MPSATRVMPTTRPIAASMRVGERLAGDDRDDTDHEDDDPVAGRVEGRVPESGPDRPLRGRDVGDRGDVVPVDAVAEPEGEGRHDQGEAESGVRSFHAP